MNFHFGNFIAISFEFHCITPRLYIHTMLSSNRKDYESQGKDVSTYRAKNNAWTKVVYFDSIRHLRCRILCHKPILLPWKGPFVIESDAIRTFLFLRTFYNRNSFLSKVEIEKKKKKEMTGSLLFRSLKKISKVEKCKVLCNLCLFGKQKIYHFHFCHQRPKRCICHLLKRKV